MFSFHSPTKSTKRKLWPKVVAGFAIILFSVMAWGKYDFCSGWSKHYEKSASQLRIDASSPQLPTQDIYDCLIVAEWHDVIARKYWRAAFQPWPFGGYPKSPLISKQEQMAILEQLTDTGQLPKKVADTLLLELLTAN